MAIDALSFDLNDTLLDNRTLRAAIERTCAEVSVGRISADQLMQANREVWSVYWPSVEDDWTLGVLSGETVSTEAWRRTLRACGCEDEALVVRLRDLLRRHTRECMRLFEDVRDVLDWLTSARLRLVLITNGAGDTQRDALRTLEIEQYFEHILVSGEVRVAKPDPAIFRTTLEQLDVAPARVWHIGDNLPLRTLPGPRTLA
jgi:putative hydrolase of the HAD superfamily